MIRLKEYSTGPIHPSLRLASSLYHGVFFETFKNKIHADYMNSVDTDDTNFVSKCTTHIKGAKFET